MDESNPILRKEQMSKSKTSKIKLHFERNSNRWATIDEIVNGTGLNSLDVRLCLIRYSKRLFETRTSPLYSIPQYRLSVTEGDY